MCTQESIEGLASPAQSDLTTGHRNLMDWLGCLPRAHLLSGADDALLVLLPWTKMWKYYGKYYRKYVRAEESHFINTGRQPWPQSQTSEDANKSDDTHISR